MNLDEYKRFIQNHSEGLHYKWTGEPAAQHLSDLFITYGLCTGQTLREFATHNARAETARDHASAAPCQHGWWIDWRDPMLLPSGWRKIRARATCLLHTCMGRRHECTIIDSKPWYLWVKHDCPAGEGEAGKQDDPVGHRLEKRKATEEAEAPEGDEPSSTGSSLDPRQRLIWCYCTVYQGRHINGSGCRTVIDISENDAQ